ncbi:MAG TPA: SusC/RagA family TonB-linked outer membrane protein, partial [Emticicia sp.]
IFPDWVGLTTQTGSKAQHTLCINGGSENSRYYISGTYLDSKGVAVNDEFKRISGRINVETDIRKWLTLGTNTQLLHSNRDGLPATFGGYSGSYRLNPLTSAYDETGNLTIYPWPQDTFFGNPLSPTLASNLDDSYKIITNNYLNIKLPFIQGLSYRLNTGFEYTTRDQKTYYGSNTRKGLLAKGDLNMVSSKDKNIVIENILNYNRSFGDHTIGFTGLLSMQEQSLDKSELAAEGFPNDILTYYQANVALSVSPDAAFAKETLLSQMARVNYSYKSKYLLTLTARRDGFSGFGKNNKFGFFPSMAIGWNIGQEDFLAGSKIVDDLKIRASYGSNGNQAVSAYKTLARMETRSYVDGSTTLPGYVPISLGTPDLKWETTTAFNLGVDFSLLQGRIQGSLDGYSKQTRDILLDRAISSVHGISSIVQNIGKTANKGIELGANSTNVKNDKFNWSSTVSFSLNRNQIKDLYGDGRSDTLNQWFIGYPIDVSYGYVYNGVWQLDDDLSSSPQPNTLPGFAKVKDLNRDGKITPAEDKTIIG